MKYNNKEAKEIKETEVNELNKEDEDMRKIKTKQN